MKTNFLLAFMLLNLHIVQCTVAQSAYRAADIAELLRKDANAVIRLQQEEFIVQSRAKAVSKMHLVVTICNKNAQDHATLYVPYDQLSKVKSLEGKMYNAAGEEVKRLKKKDIQDMGAYDGFSIFSDNRLKAASLEHIQYPYTVEWIYEIETENMMFYPVWFPQNEEKLAVEKSVLTVEMPVGMQLRYLENELAPACRVSQLAGKTRYQWETKSLPAMRLEPMSPALREITPLVYTAPDEFEVAGYAGKMDSWQSYGQWINQLNSSRNDLPVAAIEEIRRLTASLPERQEKIRAVYAYLQANTRYVSIQLGIGGWQPFKASFVHEKGYGDCKALSFYAKTLLEAIDIPSYYTLNAAGHQPPDVKEDFPMSTFNHAILCVPNGQDTLWLECTSQTNPFNYLGHYTSGRKAVMVTEQGAKVVHTPTYRQQDNLQFTVAHVDLRNAATKISMDRSYQGLQFENHQLSRYIHLGKEEQQKWMYAALDIPSFEIEKFSLSLEEKALPVASLHSDLMVTNLFQASGKRSFITLNLANRRELSYPAMEARKTDFRTGFPFIDTDSVIYYLPANTTVEYLMEDIRIESKFGLYEATARAENGTIVYTRMLRENGGRFPSGQYNEYIEFRQQIAKADHSRAVIQYP